MAGTDWVWRQEETGNYCRKLEDKPLTKSELTVLRRDEKLS